MRFRRVCTSKWICDGPAAASSSSLAARILRFCAVPSGSFASARRFGCRLGLRKNQLAQNFARKSRTRARLTPYHHNDMEVQSVPAFKQRGATSGLGGSCLAAQARRAHVAVRPHGVLEV